jgi:hypothetical protein
LTATNDGFDNKELHLDHVVQGGGCHCAGGDPTSGKHTEHIASNYYVSGDCDDCHGANATTGSHTGHNLGSNTVVANISAWDDATRNCTNDCHGPTDFNWFSGTIVCANCHASSYIGLGNPPAIQNAHDSHQNNTQYVSGCVSCHPDNSPFSSHASLDGTTSTGGGVTNITTYVSTSNCTNDCHANNGADFLDSDPYIQCTDCHAASFIGKGNPPNIQNAHAPHQNNTQYVSGCVSCHPDNTGTHATLDGTVTTGGGVTNITTYVSTSNCTNDCTSSTPIPIFSAPTATRRHS